jgi:hypothetical protein
MCRYPYVYSKYKRTKKALLKTKLQRNMGMNVIAQNCNTNSSVGRNWEDHILMVAWAINLARPPLKRQD